MDLELHIHMERALYRLLELVHQRGVGKKDVVVHLTRGKDHLGILQRESTSNNQASTRQHVCYMCLILKLSSDCKNPSYRLRCHLVNGLNYDLPGCLHLFLIKNLLPAYNNGASEKAFIMCFPKIKILDQMLL